MLSASWIREQIEAGDYFYSRHGDQERQNDNLRLSEVEDALRTGVVLEKYPDTGRGASSLIAGFTSEGKPVHVVCGRRGSRLVVITVYVPKPPKFKSAYERGKKR